MGLDWHFLDYPKNLDEDGISETVLLKMADKDDPWVLAQWDAKEEMWLDVGRDFSSFGGDVVAWANLTGPESNKPMPGPRRCK